MPPGSLVVSGRDVAVDPDARRATPSADSAAALTIRTAGEADAETVVQLVRELCLHEHEPEGAFTAEVFTANGCGENAIFAVMLAELAGKAVGYVLVIPSFDSSHGLPGVYVADLYVCPAVRRQGVGRALMAAAARVAVANGGGFLWLTSAVGNDAAHGFYRTLSTYEEPVVAFAVAGADLDRLVRG